MSEDEKLRHSAFLELIGTMGTTELAQKLDLTKSDISGYRTASKRGNGGKTHRVPSWDLLRTMAGKLGKELVVDVVILDKKTHNPE